MEKEIIVKSKYHSVIKIHQNEINIHQNVGFYTLARNSSFFILVKERSGP